LCRLLLCCRSSCVFAGGPAVFAGGRSTRISALTSVLTSKSTYSYVHSPKIMRSYLFRSIFENLAGYHSSCIHRAFAINFLHRHHVHFRGCQLKLAKIFFVSDLYQNLGVCRYSLN
jgi:hypothetical protein